MSDTLDLLTLTEAKQAIGTTVAATDLDTTIAAYVTACSRLLDANCGPLVNRTYTPASTISSVIEYQGTTAVTITAQTPGTLPVDGYVHDQPSGYLYRTQGGVDALWYQGRQNITVTYTAGRFASTSAVDPRVKQAAAMLLRHLWAMQYGSGNIMFGEAEVPVPVGFAIPNRVREMLASYWLVPAVS